jgi:chemotaxis protein MotA
MIILVGTGACLFNGFPMAQITKFPKLVKILFNKPVLMPHSEVSDLFVQLSQLARREGLLALEPRLDELKDPSSRRGLPWLSTAWILIWLPIFSALISSRWRSAIGLGR